MRFQLIVLALVGAACSRARETAPDECPFEAPTSAVAFDSTRPASLEGAFRLVHVNTTMMLDDGTPLRTQARLTLKAVDAAQRDSARVRTPTHTPRANLQLVGDARQQITRLTDPAELDGGTLYIGCRDCLDGAPAVLRDIVIVPDGFRGNWYYPQTGTATAPGAPAVAPAASGYFCAIRER